METVLTIKLLPDFDGDVDFLSWKTSYIKLLHEMKYVDINDEDEVKPKSEIIVGAILLKNLKGDVYKYISQKNILEYSQIMTKLEAKYGIQDSDFGEVLRKLNALTKDANTWGDLVDEIHRIGTLHKLTESQIVSIAMNKFDDNVKKFLTVMKVKDLLTLKEAITLLKLDTEVGGLSINSVTTPKTTLKGSCWW